MYNFLLKNGTAVAMGVGTLMTIVFILSSVMGLSSAGYDMGTDLVAVDYKNIGAFNLGLGLTLILSVVAIIIMVVAIIVDLVKGGKSGMKMIIGIVAMFAVFFLLYATAQFETGGKWDELNSEFGITEGSSKLITAGILGCGILGAIAIAAIVIGEVRNFFK
jgi:hypothetical protein